MAMSSFTRKCLLKLWICRILDWICLGAPLIVYAIIALANGGIGVAPKLALTATLIVALILTIVNTIAQKNLKCPIWIVIIGLYIAIAKWLLPLVIILAVASILDDLVFTPLIHYYYTKTVASRTIDQREAAEEADKREREIKDMKKED